MKALRAGLRQALAGNHQALPLGTGIVAGVSFVLFLYARFRGGFHASSTLGLIFGIAAALALVAVMLYSARRSLPANRKLGATRIYLEVHLWVGALFLLLFLLHTDFSLPGSLLLFLLWALSLWVVITGAIGIMLQRTLPKLLQPAAAFEVNLLRVPELLGELRTRAEGIAAKADPRVKLWYEQQIAGDMATPRMVTAVLMPGTRMARRTDGGVDLLRRTLTAEDVVSLESIRELQATKHEIDVQYTLQRILRGWLYSHLPVAIALLGLVVLHVFFILYY